MTDNNKNISWCPSANCGCFAEKGAQVCMNIQIDCKCGNPFCFKFKKEGHLPATCDTVNKWYEKVGNEELQNIVWIKNHTKVCPKCKMNI